MLGGFDSQNAALRNVYGGPNGGIPSALARPAALHAQREGLVWAVGQLWTVASTSYVLCIMTSVPMSGALLHIWD